MKKNSREIRHKEIDPPAVNRSQENELKQSGSGSFVIRQPFYMAVIAVFCLITILFTFRAQRIYSGVGSLNFAERLKKPVLPYYTAQIHYPPNIAIGAGIVALLNLLTIYLIADFLFFQRFRGWKRALSVILSIVVIISGTEQVMGYYVKLYPQLHSPHPTLFWELSPNLPGGPGNDNVSTNSHGFRSPEISIRKPGGQYRIMILGDSSAFGFRVKNRETFGAVLSRMLKQKYPDRDIRLINSAVAGYTTYQAAVFMKEKGWEYSPDIIIIAFNNDSQSEWKQDVERAPPAPLIPILRIIYRSNIYLGLKKVILNSQIKRNPKFVTWPEPGQETNRISLEQLRKNVDYIIDGSNDRNIKIIAVAMPVNVKNPPDLEYKRIMMKAAEEEDFPSISFLEKFRAYPAEDVFLDNLHPTVEGHRIIGESLFQLIAAKKWLEK